MKWLIFIFVFNAQAFAEYTPVELQGFYQANAFLGEREWQAPNYDSQEGAIGYTKETFKVSEELKERVDFWIDIFSKYTTSQGVLHDSKHVSLVYEEIDFSHIENDESLSPRQISRAKRKYIKERKAYLKKVFKKLSTLKESEVTNLSTDEMRLWLMFEKVDEKNKFLRARKKGRLRLQLGLRDSFLKGIYYSGRYMQEMEEIFKSMNLPLELVRLPFIESSFNLKARSKVGASGIWQLMRGTGKMYLKISPYVDERNDPLKATIAAAKILKRNYEHLQSWPLALTAYNYGLAGIKRIVRRAGTNRIEDLIGSRATSRYGFATESFYPSYLAALIVDRDAKKYFKNIKWAKPFEHSTVQLDRPVYFKEVQKFFNSKEEFLVYNPHFTKRVVKNYFLIPKRATVYLPKSKNDEFLAFLGEKPKVRKSNKTREYRISRGDTLSDIAMAFKVRVRDLMELNNISNPRRLRPGQKIIIP